MSDEATHPALVQAPPGETNGNGNGEAGRSTLDWLRARHEELRADRELAYKVPGYGGRLVLVFGPAPWAALSRVQALASAADDDTGQALLNINLDIIVASCRAVRVVDDEGALVSIDAESAEPVRIGARLAELLGTGTTTARATLRWLFPNDVAVGSCAGELLSWTQDADAETVAEFSSE
jgi:hypothetical protein